MATAEGNWSAQVERLEARLAELEADAEQHERDDAAADQTIRGLRARNAYLSRRLAEAEADKRRITEHIIEPLEARLAEVEAELGKQRRAREHLHKLNRDFIDQCSKAEALAGEFKAAAEFWKRRWEEADTG